MTRRTEINTGWFVLAFPRNGRLEMVINGDSPDKKKLELLLSDRKANGDAFDGEAVCELWTTLQWFSQSTISGKGSEPASACFFPKPCQDDGEVSFRIHYQKQGDVARALVASGLGWFTDNGNVFNSRDALAMEVFENALAERDDREPNLVRRFVNQ